MSNSSAAGSTSAPPASSSTPVSAPSVSVPAAPPSRYERWNERLVDWCPYVTLAVPAILSVALSTDPVGERLVTAGLVGLAALWVYFGYTRAPKPRQAHRVRMIVYFIGLLVIASVLATREYLFFIFMITGFFHATVLRPWPLVIVGVFATSVLVNTVIGGLPTDDRVVVDLGGDHRHPDARDRRRRDARRADGRAERAAAARGRPARGRARGERRPARPVADAGPRGRRARRAAAHGGRDPRHDRPGPDRGRHPARGGRAGQRAARGLATARPERDRPGPRQPRGGAAVGRGLAARSGSRPPGCPKRSPTSPGSGRS